VTPDECEALTVWVAGACLCLFAVIVGAVCCLAGGAT